ncbi:hypothetical protein AGABI2DRAFT_44714, partial [Agaricus bisporus var. bisporus H97]|uniref:hypothetical protein n=1 Tax=Agaricus bisporus var. bisporus (strain H97 / ATCC MYA-4626 / FGSC 10389) TaxID=936046 RepID=UPI00029F60B8
LSEADLSLLRKYALKIEEHITERTFAKFACAFPSVHHDSLKITKKHVRYLSGFNPVSYGCCVNSCICFVGPHEALTECPKCQEKRLDDRGKPRKSFVYIPLIPRLQAMVANRHHAGLMRYRADFEPQPGIITDIFDGSYYLSLLNTVVPASGDHPFFYFSDERDIALGLSTDGFSPFKRRDKTC